MSNKKLRYSAGDFDGEYVLPFKMYSGSSEGGYHEYVVSTIGRNIDITNLHFSQYENGLLTSPYSERFSGISSRKNSVGSTEDRLETYVIDMDATNITVTPPENRIVVDRSHISLVNVQNIKKSTSSFGNYDKTHDIVSGIGADSKMWISEYTGSYYRQEVALLNVTPINYELPVRNKNKCEIITRFSSPGAIDETTDGHHDFATGQYCVYSTVNYRNSATRKTFNKESAAHFDITDFDIE